MIEIPILLMVLGWILESFCKDCSLDFLVILESLAILKSFCKLKSRLDSLILDS